MDIFQERDEILRTESLLERNQGNNFMEYKREYSIPIKYSIKVGDIVWAKGKGPREVTGLISNRNGEISQLVLAEEPFPYAFHSILPYNLHAKMDRIEFLESIDWKFIFKIAYKILLIPIPLYFSMYCGISLYMLKYESFSLGDVLAIILVLILGIALGITFIATLVSGIKVDISRARLNKLYTSQSDYPFPRIVFEEDNEEEVF